MIFPYELTVGPDQTQVKLIQPAEMAQSYPNCYSYLQARQTELEKRNITGGKAGERQFYQFGRSQSITKFGNPKIILPALSQKPCYAYDDANVVVTGGGNGPYYLVRQFDGSTISNFYLLAVLNHPLCEAFVRKNTSVFGGGYYSHGKQFIEDLPIPIPSDQERLTIETLVVQLINALDAVSVARTPQEEILHKRQAADLQVQIEAHITMLFDLSTEDISVVKAVPIPE
jgi:hypothetical protein